MPLPALLTAPLALRLAQLAAAAAIGAALAARRGPERLDIATEDALDRVPEGADLRLDPRAARADAEARWRRAVRLGSDGPGVEIDLCAVGRLRARRLRAAR
ncbi:MAG: hypothetical protein ACFCUS_00465 [Rubrimonas sp.]|uniref:hypothetical protein n=1 Tax=Rubrimonas sp. TaxID=2036015 RepID=UPI002FDD22F3